MPKLFISYRRADSQYVADIVYEYMGKHFSKENVFLDISIPFGVDFRQYLHDQVADHDVILVLIGPEWAATMQERANQANDFVRIEIESALKLGKLVIPVLVMGAEMPDFSHLPESIQDLQWRNSAQIRRQPDLEGDCARLAESIQQVLGTPRVPALTPAPEKKRNPTITDILPPPFAWIDITVGKVTLVTEPDWCENYIPRGGSRIFEVAAFTIARYPITNAQFATFIEAGGYDECRWWTDAGWEARQKERWTQPRYWTNEIWNGADQPIVGVSWYEAIAFCTWLDEQLYGSGRVTLPTEQQWQYAAQGGGGRTYPWGNTFDKNRGNTLESGIGKTTPVTQYMGKDKGDNPFGGSDMAGNVWEWCLTDSKTGHQDIRRNAPRRVLRGGSWNHSLNFARAVSRFFCDPGSRGYCFGFRVCRPPSP